MREREEFDVRKAWKKAIEAQTAICRACGDPAIRMKLKGFWPGCYCRTCYGEVVYGNMPKVTGPLAWKRVKRRM